MAQQEIFNSQKMLLAVGDVVIDPMDGEHRTIAKIEDGSLYMQDGGVMGADEIGVNGLHMLNSEY